MKGGEMEGTSELTGGIYGHVLTQPIVWAQIVFLIVTTGLLHYTMWVCYTFYVDPEMQGIYEPKDQC